MLLNVMRVWCKCDYKLQVTHMATLHTFSVSVFMSVNYFLVSLYFNICMDDVSDVF
jgi:hypothetical protein